jgi:hypothetical protein
LESPDQEQLVADLEFGRDDRLNDEMLSDTAELLRKKRDERSLVHVKEIEGDERLRQLQSKLRDLNK